MFRRTDPALCRTPTGLPAAFGPAAMLTAALGIAAFAAPARLGAQEGTITYTHSVKLEFDFPAEFRGLADLKAALPPATTSTKLLHFGPAGSMMIEGEDPMEAARAGNAVTMKSSEMPVEMPIEFISEMMVGMKMYMGSAGGINVLQNVYEDYDTGTLVETHEFLGRTFRVTDERPSFAWQLTTEQAVHLGYPVMKATTQHDSTTVEAWFTPAIPVQGGPASYGGLPGMILVLSLNDGHTQYQATEVTLQELEEGLIHPPGKGRVVSREEFQKIVEEKMEELMRVRGPRKIGSPL